MSPHDIREVFASLGALPFIGEDGLAHRSREAISTLTSRVAELEGAINAALDELDACHALSDDHESKEILRAALRPSAREHDLRDAAHNGS